MSDPIKVEDLETYGQLFRAIDRQPAPELLAPTQIVDGPLSQGVGGVHNEMSQRGTGFAGEMTGGMVYTGQLLLDVKADYDNVDQNNADSIRKLFAPPPGEQGDAAPESGR